MSKPTRLRVSTWVASWLFAISFTFLTLPCQAREITSASMESFPENHSLNGRKLLAPTSEEAEAAAPFTFLVGGHTYGSPRNKESTYPSASLLGNIQRINQHPAELIFLLGDLVRTPEPAQLDALETSLLEPLRAPVFNAVGNHDVIHRERYEERYGETYFYFRHRSAAFVVLDTEEEIPGDIAGSQLQFLTDSLQRAENDPLVEVVFLLSHKLVWSVGPAAFRVVRNHVNAPYGYPESNNFLAEIEPQLNALSKKKAVVWISGDIGVDWSKSLFFHQAEEGEPIYLAVGLGDTRQDALVEVTVRPKSPPEFAIFPLATESPTDLKSQGVDSWQAYFDQIAAEQPRPPSLLEQVLRLPQSRRFWAGVLVATVPLLCLLWLRGRGQQPGTRQPGRRQPGRQPQ